MIHWRRNRPAVGYPPYVCPPYVANACSAPLGDEGKPRPYNASVFWFGAIKFPVRFGDPVVGLRRRNRLAVGCPPYDHRPAVGCPPYDHRPAVGCLLTITNAFHAPISSVASCRR
ncbi:MAG: hypothetical protein LBQ66_11430 [Planctomycetaceae bacterium]|nr:hypothetical protein [Planctomycetaceae bacterium]